MLGLTPGFSSNILSLAPQTQFAPSTLTDVCQVWELRSGKTPHLFEVLFTYYTFKAIQYYYFDCICMVRCVLVFRIRM